MEINELEYTSIFIESSENLGVVFDSYKKLGPDTEAFLDKIEDAVSELNKKADEAKINLKGDISSYKTALGCAKTPEPIDIRKVKPLKNQIKQFRTKLEGMLNRLARIKDKVAYGGNYIRAIIKRPKVYGHNMDDEKYDKTNGNIREVNRAIDWVEKAMIDLFNLVDQDINILTIVDKIYASNHIFEGAEELPAGCYIGEDQADIAEMLPGSSDRVSEANYYMFNTMDKKTGTAPGYIKGNHNMASYGEDDPADNNDADNDKSLDDYRHPDIGDDDYVPKPSNKRKPMTTIEDDIDDEEHPKTSSSSGPVNYYYYTYQNSLNKNTDSFNKYRTDDHSTGKQINSNNTSASTEDEDDKEYKTIGTDEAVQESTMPWELNIFPKAITEGFFDIFKKSGETVKRPIIVTPAMNEILPTLLNDIKNKMHDALKLPEYDLLRRIQGECESIIDSLAMEDFTKYKPIAHITISKGKDVICAIYGLMELGIRFDSWPERNVLNYANIDPDDIYTGNGPGKDEDNITAINIQMSNLFMEALRHVTDHIKEQPDLYNGLIKSVGAFSDGNRVFAVLSDRGTIDTVNSNDLTNEITSLIAKYGANTNIQFESAISEDAGDADDDRPQADHPVRDAMIDADRKMQTAFQNVKKTGQAAKQLYRSATIPVRRAKDWLNKEIAKWKDADETEIKEQLADPNARKNIFYAIKTAIDNGAYLKAGILLNPVILGLHLLKRGWGKHSEERIRNEMILELQREMEIIDEKIKDAEYNHDNKAKYQLMRFKTEVQKKLWRVTGGKGKVSKFL